MNDFNPFLRFVSKTTYFMDQTVVARDCRIIYVISGEGLFKTKEASYPLKPNTLLAYPYGLPYHISKVSESFLFYTINYDFSLEYTHLATMIPTPVSENLEAVLDTVPKDMSDVFSRVCFVENALWAKMLIGELYKESLQNGESCREICSSYLKILLLNVYKSHHLSKKQNSLCKRVKELINADLKLNIKTIAEILNYHPFYLNEVFKKHELISLHKYISQCRLIAARELLCTSSLSLEEIAISCGFSSISHFSSTFKKTYQIPPSHLRK